MGDVARLDREAARRVLRRASELADGDHAVVSDAVDVIDERTLVAAAVEAGIPAVAVHRALAVERLGPSPEAHVGDPLVGPTTVVVDAELPGAAAEVLARVDAWLVAGHHLRRDRLRDGHGEWSKRHGMVGATVRSLRRALGEGQLGELERIDATARDTGAGTCVVRLVADRRRDRAVRTASGLVVGGMATAGVAVAAAALGPAVLLAAPVAVAAGVGAAATGRRDAGRVERELDLVVDAVDQRLGPARLSVDLVRRVTGLTRRA